MVTKQRSLFDPPPPPRPPSSWYEPTPREIGKERGESCEAKAEIELMFDPIKAGCDAVLWLFEGGQASGEEIVDYLKSIGHRAGDDRAFGPLFARLAREELIQFVGYAARRKGHGTSGAKVWKVGKAVTEKING